MAKTIKSPQDAVANYLKGMAGASGAYTKGTASVTESPMQKAAQNLDKAAANYQAAVSSGQMAAALNAVPIGTWKAQCAAGAGRLQSGAQKGQAKYLAANQALQPVYQSMRQAAMSNGGSPGQKAAAAIDLLVAAGRRGKAQGM